MIEITRTGPKPRRRSVAACPRLRKTKQNRTVAPDTFLDCMSYSFLRQASWSTWQLARIDEPQKWKTQNVNKAHRPLLVIGTRPEAIKMAPVFLALRKRPEVKPIVCFTGQHRELLAQASGYFGLTPDIDLDLMRPNQSLNSLFARCLERLDEVILRCKPDAVIAQGDTTTVAAASVASFHRNTPFVHVEAGLRTGNLNSPWPEEFNRRVAAISTAIHCAPTKRSARNLLNEGINEKTIHVTGNTVIDALFYTIERERSKNDHWLQKYPQLKHQRMVLITSHRRENHGDVQAALFKAIGQLARTFQDVCFLFPVHPNPAVRETAADVLGRLENVILTEPADYPEFVWLMDKSTIIITDSGGVQEEAPSLGKPVLVTRDTTERPEAIEANAATLIGLCPKKLFEEASKLLGDKKNYENRRATSNPYGDGRAAERIADLITEHSVAKRAA